MSYQELKKKKPFLKSLDIFQVFCSYILLFFFALTPAKMQHLLCCALLSKHHAFFSDRAISPHRGSPFLSCVYPFQGCEVTGVGHSSHWEALCLHLLAATHHIRRPSTATHDGLWWVFCLSAELTVFCKQLDDTVFFFYFIAKTHIEDSNVLAFKLLYLPNCSFCTFTFLIVFWQEMNIDFFFFTSVIALIHFAEVQVNLCFFWMCSLKGETTSFSMKMIDVWLHIHIQCETDYFSLCWSIP